MSAENRVVEAPLWAWSLDLVSASDLESIIIKHTFGLGYLFHSCCCYDLSVAKKKLCRRKVMKCECQQVCAVEISVSHLRMS